MTTFTKGHMKLNQLLATAIKRYFFVGLIALVPIYVTFQILLLFVSFLDGTLARKEGHFLYIIPERFHPDILIGVHIPGLGVIFTVLIILIVGVFSRNLLGRQLLLLSDRLFDKIPGARIIYNFVKQAVDTVSKFDKKQFSRVILVEYPRKELYTIAFVMGEAEPQISSFTKEPLLKIFVPTTPNPTSGFFLMVPAKDAIPIDMSIEDAFKVIVSGGLVLGKDSRPRLARDGD